jgi:ABC-type multidrug transport system fused ATPase/permease subunit
MALDNYRSRFLLNLYKRMSMSLYTSYFRRGLLFIRNHGTDRLEYEINNVCYSFSQNLLSPLARIMGDMLLIVLAVIALLIYSPFTSGVLCLSFIPFMLLYLLVIKHKSRTYGERELKARMEQCNIVSDTFNGYTDLQVNGAYNSQQQAFGRGMDSIARNRLKMDTLLRLPTPLSELAVIVGLTILAAVGKGDVTMVVGLFAICAFRLMPAMRSIMSGWALVQNSTGCVDILYRGLADAREQSPQPSEPINFNRNIRLADLSYAYAGGKAIFDNFNLEIRKGEYVGISGMSGVGKSTLFNLLLGFIHPDKGQVLIDDTPLTSATSASWLAKIGYVAQDVFIFNGTIIDNIALGDAQPDRNRIIRLLQKVSLGSWLDTLPDGLDTSLGERGCKLSGGQKQRIGIARALYRNVELLLLDEATSSLDNDTEREVIATINEIRDGLTVIAIAHRTTSLSSCDRIITI